MTSKEFKNLVKKAMQIRVSSIECAEPLFGIGLKSERESRGITRRHKLLITPEAAIAFIRYQTLRLDGTLDLEELNDIKWLFINFVEVVY